VKEYKSASVRAGPGGGIQQLFFEGWFVVGGDLGVGLEFVVVAIGEVGAVVAAAAFFAGQSTPGD